MVQSRDGRRSPTRSEHQPRLSFLTLNRLSFTRLITTGIALLTAFLAIITWRCYVEDLRVSGSWGCEMSWMTPWYELLEWDGAPVTRYGLYLYREQGWDTERKVRGHPVIFIPGNAGSYQQVRSIASSASRQYYREPGEKADGMSDVKKLDFFTLDLKEEFSAFHARTLDDQALYIRHSIQRVLREYDHLQVEERPNQVTLLAHSMGGIAARLAIDADTSSLVDVIITMSTPHTLPPLTLEYRMEQIYKVIEARYVGGTTPPIVSLCGGISDSQVVSESCALPLRNKVNATDLAVFTTGIPGVWTGVDHQAIVWCHQIRWRIARMMLAMTQSNDTTQKLAEASYWLLGRTQSLSSSHSLPVQHTAQVTSSNMSILWSSSQPEFQVEHCDETGDCTQHPGSFELLPWPKDPSAPFPLPGEGIKADEVTHLLDVQLPSNHGTLHIRSSDGSAIALGTSRNEVVHGRIWTRNASQPFAAHHTLHFNSVPATALHVHRLAARSRDCQGRSPLIKHTVHTSPAFHQTTYESRFHLITSANDIRLHSHTNAAPFSPFAVGPRGLQVEIFQTPDCPIDHIEITTDYAGMAAKVVTRYRITVVAWTAGWVGLALLWQSRGFDIHSETMPFVEALEQVGRWWMIKWVALLCAGGVLQSLLSSLPGSHILLLGTSTLDLVPVTGFFAICAFGLATLLWYVISSGASITAMVLGQRNETSPISNIDGTSVQSAVRMALITIIGYVVMPHQLVFMVSYAVLYTLWTKRALKGIQGHLTDLLPSILIFLTVLLPFTGPGLFVWARKAWGSWNDVFAVERSFAHVGSIICLVVLCAQGSEPKRRPIALRAYQISLSVFSAAAFLAGSRYTWILDVISDLVLLSLIAILW